MVKPIQRDSEKSESVVDTMDTRDSNDDNQTMKHTDDDETVKSAYSATPSSDCTCNSDKYSCKVAAEENSDDFMVDSMPSYTYNSVSPPGDNMKYVEVAHCENRSLSNAILRLQCNTLGIDDTSVSQPTNQPIDKHTPEDQDPFPYVSFSLKGYTAGSDTKTTLDDFSADYVQETI